MEGRPRRGARRSLRARPSLRRRRPRASGSGLRFPRRPPSGQPASVTWSCWRSQPQGPVRVGAGGCGNSRGTRWVRGGGAARARGGAAQGPPPALRPFLGPRGAGSGRKRLRCGRQLPAPASGRPGARPRLPGAPSAGRCQATQSECPASLVRPRRPRPRRARARGVSGRAPGITIRQAAPLAEGPGPSGSRGWSEGVAEAAAREQKRGVSEGRGRSVLGVSRLPHTNWKTYENAADEKQLRHTCRGCRSACGA